MAPHIKKGGTVGRPQSKNAWLDLRRLIDLLHRAEDKGDMFENRGLVGKKNTIPGKKGGDPTPRRCRRVIGTNTVGGEVPNPTASREEREREKGQKTE